MAAIDKMLILSWATADEEGAQEGVPPDQDSAEPVMDEWKVIRMQELEGDIRLITSENAAAHAQVLRLNREMTFAQAAVMKHAAKPGVYEAMLEVEEKLERAKEKVVLTATRLDSAWGNLAQFVSATT